MLLVMAILTVELSGHAPLVVYCMVNVERAEALRSTSPVAVLINTNPAGEDEKVPPAVPVITGVGSLPVWQNVPEE